jgi:hypothetical protein
MRAKARTSSVAAPQAAPLSRRPLIRGRLERPNERGDEMHLHVVRVAARPMKPPRPAKVVLLEVRRKARLEAERPERQPPRPAA